MYGRVRAAARRAATAASGVVTGILVTSALVAVPYVMVVDPVGDFPLDALNPPSQRTLLLHGADGKLFARRGGCVAEPVKLSELPPHFVDALLSMEDRRFYRHIGIDPIGVVRAVVENRAAGQIVQGGSTITQQLVKYSLLSSDRTVERKKKEAWLALSVEMRMSKDEIIERYLSSAYFGHGCYGLRAAAKEHYGITVSDLSLPQSAYLVALLKSPSYLAENPGAAERRAEQVLDAMVENGKLSAKRRATLTAVKPEPRSEQATGSYYADWVAGTMTVPHDDDYSPLPVHTSFDPELQQLAENAVDKVLSEQGKDRQATQAAMVVMRPDGRVLSMVGGRSHADSQFNRAAQARRQPGSSFKLFVYLAALRGGLKPASTVVDGPISIGGYEPKNFGGRYRGAVSVRQAFASSINTVAVRLSEAVGRKPVIDAARDLGITAPLKAQPSLALGAFEVSLLELTSAYAAVASGAYPVKPWAIAGFGEQATYTAPPEKAGVWRLDEQQDLLTLMRGTVESGSGRRARLSITAYGKTGTSQDYRDAWFVGFAGNLVVGVWVGNDDFSPMKRVTGGSLPAEIWASFMRDAMELDEEFTPELVQVAAFPADARPDDRHVKLASDAVAPKAKPQEVKVRKARRADGFFERRERPRRGFLRGLFR